MLGSTSGWTIKRILLIFLRIYFTDRTWRVNAFIILSYSKLTRWYMREDKASNHSSNYMHVYPVENHAEFNARRAELRKEGHAISGKLDKYKRFAIGLGATAIAFIVEAARSTSITDISLYSIIGSTAALAAGMTLIRIDNLSENLDAINLEQQHIDNQEYYNDGGFADGHTSPNL